MTNSHADKSREVIKMEAQRNSAQQLQRITNWLSSTDMDATLHDIISRIQEGTGAALFSDPTFHSWSTGNFQNLLCLGNAGVGKTVLAAQVIDDFIKTHRHKHSPVLFFFASWQHREIESQKPTAILANLLRQLLLWKGSILDETKQLFERHMKGTSRPDEPALLACLEREANNISDICIIMNYLRNVGQLCSTACIIFS
jgi:Cdc6-like AAA superfamily ATPase